MAANILEICDHLVDVVTAEWTGIGVQDSVERVYLTPLKLHTQEGRHVFIFPRDYENSPATRGEDSWTHQIGIVVAEKYDDPGEPPIAWMDERVLFVQEYVFNPLDFARSPQIVAGGLGLITQTSTVSVYNSERMESDHMFWSEIALTFTELRAS